MLRALELCQFIEETMKLSLLSAMNISQLMTAKYFSLKYELSDITKLPMGPLVNKLSRICDDEKLIQDIKSLTKDRNFVAHQSMLFTLGELSCTDSTEEAYRKIKIIGDRAAAIHERLLDLRYALVREEHIAMTDSIKYKRCDEV